MNVCQSCGSVHYYDVANEYVNFHENRHKLKHKSVYHRAYHVNNSLLRIQEKYNIEISYH